MPQANRCTRVAPSLRRLEELGIETSKEIPDLKTVEGATATFDSEPGLELPASEGRPSLEDGEAA